MVTFYFIFWRIPENLIKSSKIKDLFIRALLVINKRKSSAPENNSNANIQTSKKSSTLGRPNNNSKIQTANQIINITRSNKTSFQPPNQTTGNARPGNNPKSQTTNRPSNAAKSTIQTANQILNNQRKKANSKAQSSKPPPSNQKTNNQNNKWIITFNHSHIKWWSFIKLWFTIFFIIFGHKFFNLKKKEYLYFINFFMSQTNLKKIEIILE